MSADVLPWLAGALLWYRNVGTGNGLSGALAPAGRVSTGGAMVMGSDDTATRPDREPRTAPFRRRVAEHDASVLEAGRPETLLVNVGLRCDLECGHCHVRCSPRRDELMPDSVMDAVVSFASALGPALVDVTGGAPELHPRLLELLVALRERGLDVRVRSNLTALGGQRRGLVGPLAELDVGILASVPFVPFDQAEEPGRDPGLWDRCVDTLELLAAHGYGTQDGPVLDIAVNVAGPPCEADAEALEARLRATLEAEGVRFRELLIITDMPVGRFADNIGTEDLRSYVDGLAELFAPETLPRLGCRHGIEVAWDGSLWDCDFNLGAGLRPPSGFRSLDEVDIEAIEGRPISFGQHCYACTAGAGSS
jgi:radical SAM/Cys-rich protein